MHYNMEQGTPEWFEIRLGRFTASQFGKLMGAPTTKGYSDIINQWVFEKIASKKADSYVNDAMLRGTELEPVAREDYVFTTNNQVEQVGFVTMGDSFGCSPDGMVGEDGLLEIKCPKWNTQLDYLLANKLPSIYKWQVQGQLMVTDRKWCDFYSYHPDLPALLVRVNRDEKQIEKLRDKLDTALAEAVTRLNKLKEK